MSASSPLAGRLAALSERFGSLTELARSAGVSNSALTRCLKGGDPSISTARAVCAAAGVKLDWFVNGVGSPDGDSEGNLLRIPFYPVEASAGPGLVPLEEIDERYILTLPPGVITHAVSTTPASLIAIQAKGDSMEPTIRNGSMLVVNRADSQPREGIYAVSRGDALLVKRTQPRENQILRLKSDNAKYEDEDIDLKNPTEPFRIVGRVIWTGHIL